MVAAVLSGLAMAARSRSTGRQVHPKGPLRFVDDQLRQRVRSALAAKGWDQKDLADKLDVVPASITNLLKPGPRRQIKFLPKLLAVLGIDDEFEMVQANWQELPPEDRAVIVALIAARVGKKPG